MKKQRHKYEYKASPNSAATKVVRMVGFGKRVLELGFGARHTHAIDEGE